jgi:hypothetical protein
VLFSDPIPRLVKLTVIPLEWFDDAPENFDISQNILVAA